MTQAGADANFDAEQMKEDIAQGEQKAPQVNVDADYELSKEFAVADIDRTGAGAEAAEAATAHKQDIDSIASRADTDKKTEGFSDSDPQSFTDMAKEVNPRL
jgi:hypothetical protein